MCQEVRESSERHEAWIPTPHAIRRRVVSLIRWAASLAYGRRGSRHELESLLTMLHDQLTLTRGDYPGVSQPLLGQCHRRRIAYGAGIAENALGFFARMCHGAPLCRDEIIGGVISTRFRR